MNISVYYFYDLEFRKYHILPTGLQPQVTFQFWGLQQKTFNKQLMSKDTNFDPLVLLHLHSFLDFPFKGEYCGQFWNSIEYLGYLYLNKTSHIESVLPY